MPATPPSLVPWSLACLAARLFVQDPAGTGLHLRASAGPVRDRFLGLLRAALPPGTPWRRCPPGIADDRLLGGIDFGATLATGAPVTGRGLLAEADGGVVLVAGAGRMEPGTAGRLAAVLDTGIVAAERDHASMRHPARIGLVLLDEGEEAVPPALRERLAFRLDLDAIPFADTSADLAPAPLPVAAATADEGVMQALCATAEALGIGSARAVLLALRVARAHAILAGRTGVAEADAALAAQLVLAHRATRLPSSEAKAPDAEGDGDPHTQSEDDAAPEPSAPGEGGEGRPGDAVLEAALAALPPGLLAQLGADGAVARATSRAGRVAGPSSALRGRPVGVRAGRPERGRRLDLAATLRAAAPWQRLRRAHTPQRGPAKLAVRVSDLRVRCYRARPRVTTVFLVDASGSAALHRLAEAKGAVELLLGECYVRRDQVALLAFRGAGAELLLPPTGALARARRCLGALPGGGGTPLASGLSAAASLAFGLRRRGESPTLVILTDGRANIAMDGSADRPRALADAASAARVLRQAGLPALVIDISPRPQPEAAALAAALGGRCLALPRADAAALTRAVKAA